MKQFTGKEYLLIDVANNFGLDKEIFPKRIKWAKDNLDNLESLVRKADEPILFLKSVQAIRAVQRDEPVGHMVELDATTSGLQIMSAVTGCPTGALWTNLIRSDVRFDAYGESFGKMKTYISKVSREVTRAMCKDALMTVFYGSNATPIKIYGRDTAELDAFYTMCQRDLKGCWELREELISIGGPYAERHKFTLPDGFVADIKTKVKYKVECEIDELDHHKFTHIYEQHEGTEGTISLAANVIHSIDGFMVREISRRMNYCPQRIQREWAAAWAEVQKRNLDTDAEVNTDYILSLRNVLEYDFAGFSDDMVIRSFNLLDKMLNFNPAKIVCIHDAYKAHPNNCNGVRFWYAELLAELAESDIMSQIISEIEGEEVVYENVRGGYTKKEMAKLIRENAEYTLS